MTKRFLSILIAGLTTLLISGCTDFNRSAYDGIQQNQRQQCNRLFGQQREDCLARITTSYDDYKKQTDGN